MPKAQEDFQHAVSTVLEAVMFENWLRFYFISEKYDAPIGEDGQPSLYIAVPTKGMERIGVLYPHLLPMAEAINGKAIDFETSRRTVCNFVLMHVDGKSIPRNMAAIVFESILFQIQLQLFNTWVQVHETQLDQNFLEFGAWQELFSKWRKTPAAHELAEKLSISLQGAGAASTSKNAVH
ncbi:MAG: hypothetical protein IJU65_04910 [Desulfovibrio sp.]|nr:hypothetical protein [Desulfovibrio sp.]